MFCSSQAPPNPTRCTDMSLLVRLLRGLCVSGYGVDRPLLVTSPIWHAFLEMSCVWRSHHHQYIHLSTSNRFHIRQSCSPHPLRMPALPECCVDRAVTHLLRIRCSLSVLSSSSSWRRWSFRGHLGRYGHMLHIWWLLLCISIRHLQRRRTVF